MNNIKGLGGVLSLLDVGAFLVKRGKSYHVNLNGDCWWVDGRVGWNLVSRRPDLIELYVEDKVMSVYRRKI